MGVTALGIRYPASTDQYQPHVDMQELATDTDGLLAALNTRVGLLETEPAWTSYTPVWSSTGTAPALGNGTLTGAYSRHGSTIHIRIVLTLGSTSTIGTGVYRLSLPAGGVVNGLLMSMFVDSSAGGARYSGVVQLVSTGSTGDNMRINLDGATGVAGATLPVIPANGDILMISGTYEAA